MDSIYDKPGFKEVHELVSNSDGKGPHPDSTYAEIELDSKDYEPHWIRLASLGVWAVDLEVVGTRIWVTYAIPPGVRLA